MVQDKLFNVEFSEDTINILENISEDQFKLLISNASSIDVKYIMIKEINNNVYYHNNGMVSYMTKDDIYTNGAIKESKYGKMIKDFTTSLIIKRDLKYNDRIKGIEIIFNAKSDEDMKFLKRKFIENYLTLGTFQFFI